MKKIITFFSLFLLTLVIQTQAQTETKKTIDGAKIEREKFDPARNAAADLAGAVAKAQKSGKRIILDVGGEWCGWCVWMDKFFFANPDLARVRDENFVWLKINFSEENENTEFLAAYPKIVGYPHLFVLDENGKFLHSQGTAELEKGKSYNHEVFMSFLKKWSPTKTTDVSKK